MQSAFNNVKKNKQLISIKPLDSIICHRKAASLLAACYEHIINHSNIDMISTFESFSMIISYLKTKVKKYFERTTHYTRSKCLAKWLISRGTSLSFPATSLTANGECLMLCKQRLEPLDALFLKLIHVRVT